MPSESVPITIVSERSHTAPVHITRVRDVLILHCGSQTVARMVRASIKEHLESIGKEKEPTSVDVQGQRIGFVVEDDD